MMRDGEGVQLPEAAAAEPAKQGHGGKDTAFSLDPWIELLAAALAKQQVTAGGECSHPSANGQFIESPGVVVSHARPVCSLALR